MTDLSPAPRCAHCGGPATQEITLTLTVAPYENPRSLMEYVYEDTEWVCAAVLARFRAWLATGLVRQAEVETDLGAWLVAGMPVVSGDADDDDMSDEPSPFFHMEDQP